VQREQAVWVAIAVCGACCAVPRARADDMDPVLNRLSIAAGNGPCTQPGLATRCPDNEAFEHLASELAVALAPPVEVGAASSGARGFYVGVSTTVTPVRAGERYWLRGTRGANPAADVNTNVDSALAWNRIEVRKGLPFGLEAGASLGHGMDTSLWVIAGQLRVVLFEGFRSGLGALPDVALRAATQAMFGAADLSLRTQVLDVTLSKPFVVGGYHRVTPLLALQALFVNARSGRVDLTPGQNAWAACGASNASGSNADDLGCSQREGASELANNAMFRSVNQTRVRLFLGVQERYSLLELAATFGFDLAVPRLQTETPGDDLPHDVMRQVSLHLACGLHY
jgi:hypothetical protein